MGAAWASLLHSGGDAMDIAVVGGRMAGVRGRAVDRVSRGRLGPKDLFGWQANASPDRLTRPLVRRDGHLVETDWDTAMERIAARTRELLEERGPGSIGFYTSGQLFLEEYYTLAVMARAGIGTNHLDGNTRLCTATAAEALKESFGCDGQPGSFDDLDHADVIALFGHNMAETQTVQWARVLDRLASADPPRLLCVDPRPTQVARHAAVHLAPRIGTNVPLLNALLHETIRHDRVDHDFVEAHTVGFEELAERVASCTPEWAAEICDVPAARISAAAELVGTADALLSTVLQGVYQAHQATAAAVQVNNLHLIRGMLGRPGAGVLQMNGQPSAENTRECGADGDLPGFRNWQNEKHIADLAQVWNVEPDRIPHYAPPTHAMQMFRYAEQGSIGMLWISGTNPAVSLPELARVRALLAQDRLFTVVQDLYLTETARLADVVLPAATWGEKTGTITNADRTVHLCEKAVEPPGEARPDLEILLDFARRMDFRDKDGGPLIGWRGPEEAFEAWKRCSAGQALRLHGPVLRRSPRGRWHPVALHRGAARGHRAPLHGRHHLGPPGRLRELRQGPGDRGGRGSGGVPLPQPGRQGRAQGGRVRRAARDAGRAVPLPALDGPYALPLPHPHQDRPGGTARRGGPRGVDGGERGGRGPARSRRGRSGGGHHPARRPSGTVARHRHPAGTALRALPLRLLGHQGGRRPGRGRSGAGRERDDDYRLGPRVQAAPVQDSGRSPHPRRPRGRAVRPGSHHHGVGPGGPRLRARHGGWPTGPGDTGPRLRRGSGPGSGRQVMKSGRTTKSTRRACDQE